MKKIIAIALICGTIFRGAQAASFNIESSADGQVEVTLSGQNNVNTNSLDNGGSLMISIDECPLKMTVKKLSGKGNGKEKTFDPGCNDADIEIVSDAKAPEGFAIKQKQQSPGQPKKQQQVTTRFILPVIRIN